MSLYNSIAGHNPSSTQLLGILNLSSGEFGRYRDTYVKDGYIVVHTRCGGGNREDYEFVFEMAENHPWYSHNEDCDFDSTYADIYFQVPDGTDQTAVALLDKGVDPSEMWSTIFNALK